MCVCCVSLTFYTGMIYVNDTRSEADMVTLATGLTSAHSLSCVLMCFCDCCVCVSVCVSSRFYLCVCVCMRV